MNFAIEPIDISIEPIYADIVPIAGEIVSASLSLHPAVLVISNIIIGIGLFFMIMGAIGIFRFDDFYKRILLAAKVDTVGMITLVIGLGVRHGAMGDVFFTLKLVFIVVIILILNPLVAHVMARSAYASGYKLTGTIQEADDVGAEDETDLSKSIM
ncbi:MAG: monovalent cation/H(+) antiporter subunit G [Defluviitaleaceae bacterium]|nr:monovalent cation/H(+) antiporter subunit G [Defluviitaleaceae bacterium]